MSAPPAWLQISIEPPSAGHGACPVSAGLGSEERKAEGTFLSPLRDAEIEETAAYADRARLDDGGARRLGIRLFTALFEGPVAALYRAGLESNAGLAVRLVVNEPSLARIPWELLRDPDAAASLAEEGRFVRGVRAPRSVRPLRVRPPLRVLLADAFVRDIVAGDDQYEADQIRRQVLASVGPRRLTMDCLPHATSAALRDALVDRVHVLHLVISGRRSHGGDVRVVIDDGRGGEEEMSADDLAAVLAPHGVPLVVLQVRPAAQAGTVDLTNALAPALLAAGASAVVGLPGRHGPATTARLRRLYGHLSRFRPLPEAVGKPQPRRRTARRDEMPGLAICYLDSETGALFEPALVTAPRRREGAWSILTRRLGPVGKTLSAAALVVGLVTGSVQLYDLYRDRTRPQPRMTGNLNIAVAAFAEVDGQDRPVNTDRGTDLATTVAGHLGEQLESLTPTMDVQIRAPGDTGRISGRTRAERAESAREIARAGGANVVVHGVLTTGPTSVRLLPELYVDRSVVPDAEELTGGHPLGAPVEVPGDAVGNPAVGAELGRQVIDRTRALAWLSVGLGYQALNRAVDAERAFQRAVDVGGWEETAGKELLYLFLGNAAGRRKHYGKAAEWYSKALQLNPQYARAQIGLAEVRYHQASGETVDRTCRPDGVDANRLAGAVSDYERAKTMTDRPALAQVDAKIALGLGRTYLCLGLAGLGHRRDAEDQLRAVIEAYDRGNGEIRRLVVEALSARANLEGLMPDGADRTARYMRATEACQRAVTLADTPRRRGQLLAQLGVIELQFGYRSRAADAYRRAGDADPAARADYLEDYRKLTG